MYNSFRNSFLALLTCFTITSCLDQVDLNIPLEATDGLVFQGGMVKVGDQVKVTLVVRFLTNVGGVSEISKLKEAYIENDKGQLLELSFEKAAHRIVTTSTPAFEINLGMKFRFKGAAVNDRKYESDWMTLNETPKIESLKYTIEDFKSLTFQISTKTIDDAGQRKIMKWDIENNYKLTDQLWGSPPGKLCYVTSKADLRKVKMLDTRESTDDRLDDFTVYGKNVDYLLSEGYYFTVIQQALDEKSYNYFQQVNELNQREGNIYEPPAGEIISNIRELSGSSKAYGFFYVVEQDTSRIYISPEEAGNPARQCPVEPTEIDPCPVISCCDCLYLKGSTLNKPYFWEH